MPIWRLEATGKTSFYSLSAVSSQENGNESMKTSSISESQEKQRLKEWEQQKLKQQLLLLWNISFKIYAKQMQLCKGNWT